MDRSEIKLIHGSCFTGIGGFDLAAQWAGIATAWQIEKDPFCQKVLKQHFTEAIIYDDITTIKKEQIKTVDILTGGFPCQPFSVAGSKKGTSDERHLWPAMLELIQHVQPTWVIAENVRGLLNIEQGMVFEQVCADLEGEGYDVQPFIIPACAVNAPHRRDRIWFLAYSDSIRRERRGMSGSNGNGGTIANSNGSGWKKHDTTTKSKREGFSTGSAIENWDNFPKSKPGICRGNDGISKRMDRNRIKALGNAIVPQVAYQFFETIKLYY